MQINRTVEKGIKKRKPNDFQNKMKENEKPLEQSRKLNYPKKSFYIIS